MKSITITAPDDIFDQTVMAMADDFTGDDETERLEFAKEKLIAMLGEKVKEHYRRQIRQAAQETVELATSNAISDINATREFIAVKMG